jgi:3',5'-nucleoside bisphosphate phosphatase
MLKLKADLHIHTVLSPCADLEMSPKNIVKQAFTKGIDIIGISDHNSTLQCVIVQKIASDYGIKVLLGAEVTSREEVHNLVFFENIDILNQFQNFLELSQPKIKNIPEKLGYQVLVDENDQIIQQVDNYLGVALNAGINEIEEMVHSLGGIYIPAHVDRARFSLISQLGFVPNDINADALEIYNRTSIADFINDNSHLSDFSLIRNSDSHYLDSIGLFSTLFSVEEPSFIEIKKALLNQDGRKVEIE